MQFEFKQFPALSQTIYSLQKKDHFNYYQTKSMFNNANSPVKPCDYFKSKAHNYKD